MDTLELRLAEAQDIPTLVEMRRDFTFEDGGIDAAERADYAKECHAFLDDAIKTGRWQVWLAEVDDQIVSHLYVALIDKVPRPTRERKRIAYLTNVYTRPEFRNRGIGAALLSRAQAAADEADVELMIVWPSDESIGFYRRHGFESPKEPLIWEPQ